MRGSGCPSSCWCSTLNGWIHIIYVHILKYIDNICWIPICIWIYFYIERYTHVLLNWSNKVHRGGSSKIPCSGETIGFKFISTLPGAWAWYVARPGDGQMQTCIGNNMECLWNGWNENGFFLYFDEDFFGQLVGMIFITGLHLCLMGPFFRCDFIRILQSIRSFGFRGGIPKEKQVVLVPYFGPYGIWEVVLFSDVNLWSMNLKRSLGAWQSTVIGQPKKWDVATKMEASWMIGQPGMKHILI